MYLIVHNICFINCMHLNENFLKKSSQNILLILFFIKLYLTFSIHFIAFDKMDINIIFKFFFLNYDIYCLFLLKN